MVAKKTPKPKKYKCPMCREEFNVPLKHKHSKMKICPKCGYVAVPRVIKEEE